MKNAISIHIGLNRVNRDHYGSDLRLHGCRNDAEAMARVAKRAGISEPTLLLDEDASSGNVREALEAAVDNLSPSGFLLLTFAGHGTHLPEDTPRDDGREPDDQDEAFCLFDRMMRDDEVWGLLAGFDADQRVFIVLDCCHSAGIPWRLEFREDPARHADLVESTHFASVPRGIDEATAVAIRAAHPAVYARNHFKVARYSDLRAAVLVLAACAEDETTEDGPEHGVFTRALLDSLEDPPPTNYNELLERVGDRHPAGTPVLIPQDDRTREFRAMRPFHP